MYCHYFLFLFQLIPTDSFIFMFLYILYIMIINKKISNKMVMRTGGAIVPFCLNKNCIGRNGNY